MTIEKTTCQEGLNRNDVEEPEHRSAAVLNLHDFVAASHVQISRRRYDHRCRCFMPLHCRIGLALKMLVYATPSKIDSRECIDTRRDCNTSSEKQAIAGTHVTRLDEAERVVDTERWKHPDIAKTSTFS